MLRRVLNWATVLLPTVKCSSHTVLYLIILLFACYFVNTSLAEGLVPPANESVSDKESLFADSTVNITNSFINLTLNFSSPTLGLTTVTVRVFEKPSAVPLKGCSVHYQVTAINESNIVNFTNATTAPSTSSCARKCYLSGCTVAQFLPGSAQSNTGTCRLYYGNEPVSCEETLKSDKMKPDDATQIQCLRCLAIRRSVSVKTTALVTTSVATTPVVTTTAAATSTTVFRTTSPTPSSTTTKVTTTPTTKTVASTTAITTTTSKPSTTSDITSTELLDNNNIELRTEDSIQETTFPLPPPTEDLFSQATKPIVRLLESKFISNSVSNANDLNSKLNESASQSEKIVPLITPLSNSMAIELGKIAHKLIPVANAFIATTSIISWGKNKTFIGDDEKYAAQPGLFPRQPGTSIKFNFTEISTNSSVMHLSNFTATDNETFIINATHEIKTNKTISVKINETKSFLKSAAVAEKVDQNDKTRKFTNATFEINFGTNFILSNGSNETSLHVNETLVNETRFEISIWHNASSTVNRSSSLTSNETLVNVTYDKSSSNDSLPFNIVERQLSSTTLVFIRLHTDNGSNTTTSSSNKSQQIASTKSLLSHLENKTNTVSTNESIIEITYPPITNQTTVATTKSPSSTTLVSSNFTLAADNFTNSNVSNDSLQINDVAAELRDRPSVEVDKSGSLQSFGGGCTVLFHVSNASAITNALFTNTTSASSVSSCARKCYILGCKVAQYIPNAATCRIAFAAKENNICDVAHKEYAMYTSVEPVQIQCLRCSSKKLQTSLHSPP